MQLCANTFACGDGKLLLQLQGPQAFFQLLQVQATDRPDTEGIVAHSKSLMLKLASSITVKAEAALDPHRFNMFMMDLLAEHGNHISHMSGTLHMQVCPCCTLVTCKIRLYCDM